MAGMGGKLPFGRLSSISETISGVVGCAAMPDKKMKAIRREQQAREIAENQSALRSSIAETERLVDEADEILRRHRQERDDDDAAD